MHICIIGTGASGWIACTILKKLEVVKKITIIGSSKIPSIGVGESTTLNFVESFLSKVELKQFVQESDAAVKYGVYYKNWGKKDFLHYFKSNPEFERTNTDMLSWMQTLSNKNPEKHLHDLMGSNLWKFTQNNQVSLDHEEHPHSWHFDAGKFIKYMKDLNLKDEKVSFIDDTIIDAELDEDRVRYIVGESNEKYFADYYVNCCGDNKLNQEVFKEEYVSMSPYLLTNKALVYPLKYTDKQKQFHPYTVAKTMKNGWRWITPTQSRIGTGYVFSDNHISVDEATHEFIEDVGDKSIQPFLVDFSPKYNKKPFKVNSCTIGMSSGFLEPLDAPGLAATISSIQILGQILKKSGKNFSNAITRANDIFRIKYKIWCSFILHQYKTSWRNDSQFWIDHKNVNCDFYDKVIDLTYSGSLTDAESVMILHTTAGKDIQWKSKSKQKPPSLNQIITKTIHHSEYIQRFYD